MSHSLVHHPWPLQLFYWQKSGGNTKHTHHWSINEKIFIHSIEIPCEILAFDKVVLFWRTDFAFQSTIVLWTRTVVLFTYLFFLSCFLFLHCHVAFSHSCCEHVKTWLVVAGNSNIIQTFFSGGGGWLLYHLMLLLRIKRLICIPIHIHTYI